MEITNEKETVETNFKSELLNEILTDEKTTVEEKINLILGEHEADKRALIQKNYQVIGENKELKKKTAMFSENEKSFADKISSLEEELKKNSAEEHKKYYDSQLDAKTKEFEKKIKEIKDQRDFYKSSHLRRLQDDAVSEGIKELQFVNDAMKKGFINNVLSDNDFEAKEIDGQTVFLNKSNKTIQEVMRDYSATSEGKAFIKNPTSGGGAQGGTSVPGGKVLTREQYESMDPAERSEFFRNGGKLA